MIVEANSSTIKKTAKVNDGMNSFKKYANKLSDDETAKILLLQFIASWNNEKIKSSLLEGDSLFQ